MSDDTDDETRDRLKGDAPDNRGDLPRIDGPTAPDASASPGLLRARGLALAELRRQPQARSWQREALVAALLILASTAAILVVGSWCSIVDVERLRGRWLSLALLVAVQVLGIVAAIAPGKSLMRVSAAALTVAAAVAMLVGRNVGAGAVSAMPGIACSASHVAVDLIPLALVIYFVRKFAATPARVLLAGVAAATTGAMAGELSCGRDFTHVLVHHLGAALAIVVACALLARVRKPETFAP